MPLSGKCPVALCMTQILSGYVLASKMLWDQAAVLETQSYTNLTFLFFKWRITLSNKESFKSVHRNNLPFVSSIQQT